MAQYLSDKWNDFLDFVSRNYFRGFIDLPVIAFLIVGVVTRSAEAGFIGALIAVPVMIFLGPFLFVRNWARRGGR